MKMTYSTISGELLVKAQALATNKGTRALAGACLNRAAKRLTGGLSIHDLPDLPLAMDFRDDWEERFSHDGIDAVTLAEAFEQAEECLRDMLAEEGFPIDGEENE